MKASGRHPEKALSPVHVRNASRPGRYADGNGLYLVVDPSGAKRWLLRIVVNRKRTDIGLGGIRTVSLAEARETAAQMRKTARAGGDPLFNRRRALQAVPSFEDAARTVHGTHQAAWKNKKHAGQWINTLVVHVFPTMGRKPVDRIEPADILTALTPIWQTKPETARRVLQRIRTVLDWAKAAGHRVGENPVDGVTKALPKARARGKHHAALAYKDVPQFLARLRGASATTGAKLAFELTVLTAARTNEVLNARWSEVDLDERVWTIPAERMKAGREHRVPLSARCIAILLEAKMAACSSTSPDDLIFSGANQKKPLSNMVFLMILRRLEVTVTAHGFRSSFRDWASERTSFPGAVCEAALAHTIKNKTEAAYHRTDLFEKRRDLMAAWSGYCCGAPTQSVAGAP